MSRVSENFTTLYLKSPRVERVFGIWKGSLVDKTHIRVESISKLEAISENKRLLLLLREQETNTSSSF